jgi:hypothetical protein
MKKLSAFARSTLGRVLAATLGFVCLGLLIWHSDPRAVWDAVLHAPLMFPIVVALQALVVGFESWALLLLYGQRRHLIPMREVWRSSMFSFAVVVVFPFGRAVGEAARAAMLSRYVGSPLAAAAAAQIQAVTLLGNAIISIPCAIAAYLLVGTGWLFWAIIGHFAVSAGLATAVIVAGRHAGLAARLGRFFPGGKEWGSQVDEHLKGDQKHIAAPVMLVLLSRLVDTLQRMVLLVAVGGTFGLVHGFASEGINLVAASAGDAIPGQVGVIEMGYSIAADVLHLSRSNAVAMGLLFHLAVLVWVGLGFFAALVMAPSPPASGSEPMLAEPEQHAP